MRPHWGPNVQGAFFIGSKKTIIVLLNIIFTVSKNINVPIENQTIIIMFCTITTQVSII